MSNSDLIALAIETGGMLPFISRTKAYTDQLAAYADAMGIETHVLSFPVEEPVILLDMTPPQPTTDFAWISKA